MNPVQLHAAAILANPRARENHVAAHHQDVSNAAMNLATFLDEHLTTRGSR